MPHFLHHKLRSALAIAQMLLALGMLVLAARLAFRSDANDLLRMGDGLFAAGRFHDARAAYIRLLDRSPGFAPALVRLGAVATIRDERAFADQALVQALSQHLGQRDYELVRLYQGRLAAAGANPEQAAQYWAQIGERSPFYGQRRALEAELSLSAGDYANAEAGYRDALRRELPRDWRALAYSRIALLRASSDQATAQTELAHLAELPAAGSEMAIDWTAPLLPAANPTAQQLAAALSAPPDLRPQLLGQLYLGARLYPLAEAQFAAVAPDSPAGQAAAAYAAYTRWSAGDRAEGLRRLQQLVTLYPNEPRARALLALAYLTNRDDEQAKAQLETVRGLAPRAPDTHLAWGQWYATQHDYVAAADEYRRALRDAPPDQRGGYALALARFHINTAYQLCDAGRAAAEQATEALPNDAQAWTVAAATRMSCGDADGARAAATRAVQQDPRNAEATYYLGRALAALGQRTAARAALVSAADLAPASAWGAPAAPPQA
jgi:Flp pilus assembly protein TadD